MNAMSNSITHILYFVKFLYKLTSINVLNILCYGVYLLENSIIDMFITNKKKMVRTSSPSLNYPLNMLHYHELIHYFLI
jgi:hypothetical protein